MAARLLSWWQKMRQRQVAIAVTTAILVVAIVLIIIGYCFDVTGFNGYTQVGDHSIPGANHLLVMKVPSRFPS